MLIPQLLFAHMLADYILQTNWLVARKGKAWDGLALHGLMVFMMSILALAHYAGIVLLPVIIFSLLHTGQDWLKVYSGPRIKIPSIYTYMADQFSHYGMIGIMQLLVAPLLTPIPSTAELVVAATGASVITLTRFYDVTWWSNWLDMIPYMNRWRMWGYAERLSIFVLTVAGLYYLAPLWIVPRLVESWRDKQPIWRQPRGVAEMGIGVLLAIAAGLVVRSLLPSSMR